MNLLALSTKSKVFLLLAISYLLFAIFPPHAYGFATPQQSYQTTFERAVFKTDEMNLESFVFATLKAIPASIGASFFCISCTTAERQKNPGFVQDAGQMLASLYSNPPASSTQYVAYLGDKIGLVKPAYAQEQSMGFQMNLPILPVWAAMRDVAYGLSVILFVVMGFAIMFKVKVDPKTVITIQLALPKIIVGLLLITFSYAIAGLVLDFMYLLMLYISNLFVGNAANGYGGIFSSIAIPDWTNNWKAELVKLEAWVKVMNLGGGPAQTMISLVVFIALAAITLLVTAVSLGPLGFIFLIISLILVLVAVLRISITIFKAYCQLILGVVTAPLQILVGMLPGSGSVTGWLKNLISNALIFPATLFMLCFGTYLILNSFAQLYQKFIPSGSSPLDGFFSNFGVGNPITYAWTAVANPVDHYQTLSMILMSFVGMGVIMLAPNVAELVQAYVTSKAFDYGKALGSATGPVGGGIGAVQKGIEKEASGRIEKKLFPHPQGTAETATVQISRQTAANTLRSRYPYRYRNTAPTPDEIDAELKKVEKPK